MTATSAAVAALEETDAIKYYNDVGALWGKGALLMSGNIGVAATVTGYDPRIWNEIKWQGDDWKFKAGNPLEVGWARAEDPYADQKPQTSGGVIDEYKAAV